MNANVSPEERFSYWMLLLMFGFVLLKEILDVWLPSYVAAGAAGLFLGFCVPLLPGARRVPASRRLLLAGATVCAALIVVFVIDILFDRL